MGHMKIWGMVAALGLTACTRTALPDFDAPPLVCLGSGGASSSAAVTTGSTASSGPTTAGSTSATTGSGSTMSSGPRLRSYYRLTEDGVKEVIPNRWFDMDRKEDCAFAVSGVDIERCLPAAFAATPVYADDACSKPLVVMPLVDSCPAPLPAYVEPWADPANQCLLHHRRAHLGAPAVAEAPYRIEGGACVATTIEAGSAVFALGAEVPLEDFSAADLWHY